MTEIKIGSRWVVPESYGGAYVGIVEVVPTPKDRPANRQPNPDHVFTRHASGEIAGWASWRFGTDFLPAQERDRELVRTYWAVRNADGEWWDTTDCRPAWDPEKSKRAEMSRRDAYETVGEWGGFVVRVSVYRRKL